MVWPTLGSITAKEQNRTIASPPARSLLVALYRYCVRLMTRWRTNWIRRVWLADTNRFAHWRQRWKRSCTCIRPIGQHFHEQMHLWLHVWWDEMPCHDVWRRLICLIHTTKICDWQHKITDEASTILHLVSLYAVGNKNVPIYYWL